MSTYSFTPYGGFHNFDTASLGVSNISIDTAYNLSASIYKRNRVTKDEAKPASNGITSPTMPKPLTEVDFEKSLDFLKRKVPEASVVSVSSCDLEEYVNNMKVDKGKKVILDLNGRFTGNNELKIPKGVAFVTSTSASIALPKGVRMVASA